MSLKLQRKTIAMVPVLTPLLRCHRPLDDDDWQLLRQSMDPQLRCRGFPNASLWFGAGSSGATFVSQTAGLLAAAVLNCLVLWLLHAGRVRIKDLGVVGVCANAVSDLLLVLNLLVSDVTIPLLSLSPDTGDAVAVVTAIWPSVLCRFRTYITQCCLCMDIVVTASVATFASGHLRLRLLESSPCGIFMLPSLLAFVTLGLHIWFLVLSECRLLAFDYDDWLVASLPVLVTEYNWVGWVLLLLSACTQLPPCVVTAYCLWCGGARQQQQQQQQQQLSASSDAGDDAGDSSSSSCQLRLAACLLLAHLLSLPNSLLVFGYFTQRPERQRLGPSLLAMALVSNGCLVAMLALKPALFLLLHPELRAACTSRVLRKPAATSLQDSLACTAARQPLLPPAPTAAVASAADRTVGDPDADSQCQLSQ